MSALPLVAIIGRANVGKSTLFNRLIQKRTAIVNDAPGVTRDRIYGQSDWLGRSFSIVDTGGVDVDRINAIEHQVVEQALLAQEQADIVIFVADKNLGFTPQDKEVVDRIRKSGKPFFLLLTRLMRLSMSKSFQISLRWVLMQFIQFRRSMDMVWQTCLIIWWPYYQR